MVESYTKQHVHCWTVNLGGLLINLTTVYGSNQKGERDKLWSELVALKERIGGKPWIRMGDFNQT